MEICHTYNLLELGAGPAPASPVRKRSSVLLIPRDILNFFWWGTILCPNPIPRRSHFELEFGLPFYHSHRRLLGLFLFIGTRCVAIFMGFKCRRQTWVVLSIAYGIFFVSDSQGCLNECDYLFSKNSAAVNMENNSSIPCFRFRVRKSKHCVCNFLSEF